MKKYASDCGNVPENYKTHTYYLLMKWGFPYPRSPQKSAKIWEITVAKAMNIKILVFLVHML